MISRRTLLVVFFVAVFFAASVHPHPSGDAAEVTDEDATIQNNPNYTEPVEKVVDDSEDLVEKGEKGDEKEIAVEKKDEEQIDESNEGDKDDEEAEQDDDDDDVEEEEEDSEDEYYSDDEYDDEEDEEEEEEETEDTVKRVLAQALSKSRTVPRRTVKFAKKNRVKLTIAAALFAFRKEIGRIAYHILTKPKTIDPVTGRVLSRTLNISPTAVLKVLLFIDLMYKLNSGDVSGPDSKGSFLFKLLQPGNTAFVPPVEQHWTFERVNERYDKDKMAYQKAMASGASLSLHKKNVGESLRSFASSAVLGNRSQGQADDLVILLDWTKLTESVDQMSSLRDQVSFILSQHRAKNNGVSMAPVSNTTNVTVAETTEIIVMLESPGGAAADYGLAAQMMLRLSHEPGLTVTVCVDKVAASGGYMIACASSPGRLYAAPFSVLGSIGVVGSAININNVLQGWGVKPLVFRGGKNKAPVGLIGEVTKDGIKQVQSMVDATHVAFKRHVVAARPVLADNINKLATGKVWLGYEALKVRLVDRIITSDEYIGERILQGARVLRLVKYNKPRFLFPPHSPRLNRLHPMTVIRKSVKAMMVEFTRVLQQASTVDDMPLVTTDHRLTTATASLGASMQYTGGKVP